jgi:hypothetical protein
MEGGSRSRSSSSTFSAQSIMDGVEGGEEDRQDGSVAVVGEGEVVGEGSVTGDETKDDETKDDETKDEVPTSALPAGVRALFFRLGMGGEDEEEEELVDSGDVDGNGAGRGVVIHRSFPRVDLCSRVLRCLDSACASLKIEADSVSYIKGGWLRDRLCGLAPKDLDLSIHPSPAPTVMSSRHIAKAFLSALHDMDLIREVRRPSSSGDDGIAYSNLKILVGHEPSDRIELDVSLEMTTMADMRRRSTVAVADSIFASVFRSGPALGLPKDDTWCDFTCNNLMMSPSGRLSVRVLDNTGSSSPSQFLFDCMSDARNRVLRPMCFLDHHGARACLRGKRLRRYISVLQRRLSLVARGFVWGGGIRFGTTPVSTSPVPVPVPVSTSGVRFLESVFVEGMAGASCMVCLCVISDGGERLSRCLQFDCGHVIHIQCVQFDCGACPQCRKRLTLTLRA